MCRSNQWFMSSKILRILVDTLDKCRIDPTVQSYRIWRDFNWLVDETHIFAPNAHNQLSYEATPSDWFSVSIDIRLKKGFSWNQIKGFRQLAKNLISLGFLCPAVNQSPAVEGVCCKKLFMPPRTVGSCVPSIIQCSPLLTIKFKVTWCMRIPCFFKSFLRHLSTKPGRTAEGCQMRKSTGGVRYEHFPFTFKRHGFIRTGLMTESISPIHHSFISVWRYPKASYNFWVRINRFRCTD